MDQGAALSTKELKRQEEQLCKVIANVCDDPYEFSLAMFPSNSILILLDKRDDGI